MLGRAPQAHRCHRPSRIACGSGYIAVAQRVPLLKNPSNEATVSKPMPVQTTTWKFLQVKPRRDAVPGERLGSVVAGQQADYTTLVSQQTLNSAGQAISSSGAPTGANNHGASGTTISGSSKGGGSSFPVWAVVIVVLLVIALVSLITGQLLVRLLMSGTSSPHTALP